MGGLGVYEYYIFCFYNKEKLIYINIAILNING